MITGKIESTIDVNSKPKIICTKASTSEVKNLEFDCKTIHHGNVELGINHVRTVVDINVKDPDVVMLGDNPNVFSLEFRQKTKIFYSTFGYNKENLKKGNIVCSGKFKAEDKK